MWWMTGVAAAQVNVEPITSSSTEPGWAFAAGAGLAFADGNVNFLDLTGDATVAYVTAHPEAPDDEDTIAFRDRLLVNGNLRRKTASEKTVVSSRFVHARYTRMQWVRFGGEVFAQIGNDALLLQENRFIAGGGVRVLLADTKRFNARFGTGYMYEYEVRNIGEDAPDPRIEIDHRSTSYLTLRVIPDADRLTIANTIYFQPRWDKPADLQLIDDFSVRLKLTKHLALSSSFSFRYDSDAPSEIEGFDLRTSNGISVEF